MKILPFVLLLVGLSLIVLGQSGVLDQQKAALHVVCQKPDGSSYSAADADGMIARKEGIYVLRPKHDDMLEWEELPSGCYARFVPNPV